jgi:hypothetical protein
VTRLRPLSEAECYARCYGDRDDSVTIIRVDPERTRRRRVESRVSGESLRRLFEERLDTRDPDELIEPEAA